MGTPNVLDNVIRAREVFVPAIAVGELVYGALKSARVAENLQQVDAFVKANVILPCDAKTAEWYGHIKNVLRTKGRPIPENDLWIAALARQYGLTLATRDAHFQNIDGLAVVYW